MSSEIFSYYAARQNAHLLYDVSLTRRTSSWPRRADRRCRCLSMLATGFAELGQESRSHAVPAFEDVDAESELTSSQYRTCR